MPILDIVSKFNQQADSHSKSQSLNPFSDQFEQSRSPSPRFSREEYGKPVAGSKTDMRGRKARSHICREILELCTVIHDVGTYNAKKRDPDDDDDDTGEDDGTIIVSFGELFQIYTKISDKVVGLLIAAKRRGFVYFDREILFQRRDDDVLIALLKPITEINKVLKDDIAQANAPASVDVEPKPVEKKKSASSSSKTKRTKSKEIEDVKDARKATGGSVDSGHGCRVDDDVLKISADGDGGRETNCNGKVNGGDPTERVVNNGIDISEDVRVDGIMTSVELTRAAIDGETETENIDSDVVETEEIEHDNGVTDDVIETKGTGNDNESGDLDGKTEIEIEGTEGVEETERIEEVIETEEDVKVVEEIETEEDVKTEVEITNEEMDEGKIETERIDDGVETKEIDDSGGIFEKDHGDGENQDLNNNDKDVRDKNIIKNDKLDEIGTIREAEDRIQGDCVQEIGGDSPRISVDNVENK